MIPAAEVARLAAGLPPQALLVLDGAYAEYVGGLRRSRRSGRCARQRGDDPHLLEDRRPRRPARRLGLRSGPRRRGAEPGPRAVQPLDRRARWPPRRRCATSTTPRSAAPRTPRNRAALQAALARDRRALRPVARPTSSSPASATRPRPRPATGRCARAASSCAGSPATSCRTALRITVGDADACARVAEAVAGVRPGAGLTALRATSR